MKLSPAQKQMVEFMEGKGFVRYSDVKHISKSGLTPMIKKLESKGCIFKMNTYISHEGGRLSKEYKLVYVPKEKILKSIELTPVESEVLRFFGTSDWVSESSFKHISRGLARYIRIFEEYGCTFEKRPSRNPKAHGFEYKLTSVPDNLILTNRKKRRKDKDLKTCTKARTCFYGRNHAGLGWFCDYLSLTRHCRPCIPVECVDAGIYLKRDGKKKDSRSKLHGTDEFYGSCDELLNLVDMGNTRER